MNLQSNGLGFTHRELETSGVRARELAKGIYFTKTEMRRWERNLRALEKRVGARRSWGSYAERATRLGLAGAS